MTICFKEVVFIFVVLSILCPCRPHCAPQCVLQTDERTEVADTHSTTEAILTFERNCAKDFDCQFKNEKVQKSVVYLTCEEGKCQCHNPSTPVQDAPNYAVRVLNEECVGRSNAPCGTTNGITLACEEGKFCIEGRCRSQIRTRAKYSFCDEDVDCQMGLKCIEKKVPPIVSYCGEPTLTFQRECTSDYSCRFRTKGLGEVELGCKQGKCECRKRYGIPLQDTPLYDISILNDDCVVYGHGPCGTVDGITVECEEGKFCIEGKCRTEIRSKPKNSFCSDDIDCVEGLKCVARDIWPAPNFCEEP